MTSKPDASKSSGTFAHQNNLPKLPIPPLEDTCKRYLNALVALQDESEHAQTKKAVEEFLAKDGPALQEKLLAYAEDKSSYIEEFWYESYLSHSDPVVLALNPFFVLEDDPTHDRGQLPRAAALIVSSLGFIHDLRAEILSPDAIRGIALDMDQYTRLFGTARIPTQNGCRMETHPESRHIVVLRRGQFYWFDVLDENNLPLMNEREVLRNLQAIVSDADKIPPTEVARQSIGVLSTENRKTWSKHRVALGADRSNAACLRVVDSALFIVCLDDDDINPSDSAALCANFLCGTYRLTNNVQLGTCTNRWYDKLQIIVSASGAAGINFEHTGVDGHTVLRYAADVFTEGLMLLARSINPAAPTLFHAKLSPHARSQKSRARTNQATAPLVRRELAPKKLEWTLDAPLRVAIRFAETRLSDLICQNDIQALEFKKFGKDFMTGHGFSPDAFVQMAFQAAYFGLYGRVECVYEPAMTKSFLHGRTEAIRSIQPQSVDFTKTFFSDASPGIKMAALRKACERHVALTKECAQGLGQDRHLYAMYCLARRAGGSLPALFTDPGYALLGTSILSTSNCGNPALRLFGFGPVAADGYGIGYIIREDSISICASSKHLQTRRYLDTIQSYLLEVHRILVQLHRAANERPEPFVDHDGVLRDAKTGRAIRGRGAAMSSESESDDDNDRLAGYSFFDTGEVELLGSHKRTPYANIGKVLQIAEY